MIVPRYQSATRRRELRRNVRAKMGTTSSYPPAGDTVVRAAADMIDLLDLTVSGRIQLRLWDPHTGAWLTPAEAVKIVREG